MAQTRTCYVCDVCGKESEGPSGYDQAEVCARLHPEAVKVVPDYLPGDKFPRAFKVEFADGTKRSYTNHL